MKNITWDRVIMVGLIIGLIIITIKSCERKIHNDKEQVALVNALQDSLSTFKTKDGLNAGKIAVLETEKISTFTKIKTQDSAIQKLQKIVHDYRNKLDNGGSVTTIGTTTGIDTTTTPTIIGMDTIQTDITAFVYPTYFDTIRNKWIDYTSETGLDSLAQPYHKISMKVYNDYQVIIGRSKKQGTFAEVIAESPYTDIKAVRTYKVKIPPPKKFGIGVVVAYGIGDNLNTGGFVGLGLQYNFIRF